MNPLTSIRRWRIRRLHEKIERLNAECLELGRLIETLSWSPDTMEQKRQWLSYRRLSLIMAKTTLAQLERREESNGTWPPESANRVYESVTRLTISHRSSSALPIVIRVWRTEDRFGFRDNGDLRVWELRTNASIRNDHEFQYDAVSLGNEIAAFPRVSAVELSVGPEEFILIYPDWS